jgi:hypothetical protein
MHSGATKMALWAVRITGPVQVIVGLMLWSGRGYGLLPLHMVVGIVFTKAVLVVAAVAAWAGAGRRLALLTVAWGAMIPVLGMTQTRLLPGPAHWTVRAAHLLTGIVAMVMVARLARLIDQQPARPRPIHLQDGAFDR